LRISPEQIQCIEEIFGKEISTRPFDIFLYGSRTKDELSGGDIDLVAVSSNPWPIGDEQKIYRILGLLKSRPMIGDRKINLSFVSIGELNSDPFWTSITNLEKILHL
jgi:hypothetical protein